MPKIKALVDHADAYRGCLLARNQEQLVAVLEEGLDVGKKLAANRTRSQELRSEINQISRLYQAERSEELAERSRELGRETKAVEEEERELSERLQQIEIMLPNWLAPEVPIGKGDDLEKTLRYNGCPVVWQGHVADFESRYPGCQHEVTASEPFHHYNLVGTLVDQEKGGHVAQSRFYYELDGLVILDLALTLYAVEFFRDRGYADRLMVPPFMMRRSVEERATYFEAFEDTIFEVEKDELILIPSSEHSILAYYENTIFSHEDLPLRILAWSPCFRREAGAHGIDTRGIFRVKQFTKVELHSIVEEGADVEEVRRYTQDIEAFMSSLGIATRTVIVPSGDMDKRARLQVDVQAWMPGQGRFRETHSIATLDTWASEKLAIRYRNERGKKIGARDIYATAVAIQRMLCVLAENGYDANSGTIRLPEVLHKYSMGLESLPI